MVSEAILQQLTPEGQRLWSRLMRGEMSREEYDANIDDILQIIASIRAGMTAQPKEVSPDPRTIRIERLEKELAEAKRRIANLSAIVLLEALDDSVLNVASELAADLNLLGAVKELAKLGDYTPEFAASAASAILYLQTMALDHAIRIGEYDLESYPPRTIRYIMVDDKQYEGECLADAIHVAAEDLELS